MVPVKDPLAPGGVEGVNLRDVVQLEAYLHWKQEAAGSSPVISIGGIIFIAVVGKGQSCSLW